MFGVIQAGALYLFRAHHVLVRTLVVLAVASVAAHAQDKPPLPFTAPAKHMGVASCAASTCHGAVTPWAKSTVHQDEYVVWLQKDRHAQAYNVLLSERSARIARNLGLGKAYEAKICLDCHADNVAPQQRGAGFQITDGVGCESCHGGAEKWLAQHVSGKSDHAANVAAGLYPTDDVLARGRLCLSCHFGDKDRSITHRIMGAGHPRISFELDTFSATQPAHFTIDDDYKKRKHASDHFKTWAVGQVMAVDALLDGLLDPDRNHDSLFPELVYFDCYACLHAMSDMRWQPNATGLGPGTPRLADANIIMLSAFLDDFDPELAREFRTSSRALHTATTRGRDATLAAARHLKAVIAKLAERIAAADLGTAHMRPLMTAVVSQGAQGAYNDYAAAEQAIMAAASIADAMRTAGVVTPEQYKTLSRAMDKCFMTVEDDDAFDPQAFRSAMQGVQAVIPRG
jgi:hypothetical protein